MEKPTNACAGEEGRHHVVVPEEVEKAMAMVSQYLDAMEKIEGKGPAIEGGTCEDGKQPVEDEDHVEDQPPQIGEDQEDAGEEHDLDTLLWEFVGKAVMLLHEIHQAKARERNTVPPWNLFIRQVKTMVKDKKRAAKLCIDKDVNEELVDESDPLPTRDLKRARSCPSLLKTPSRNNWMTPPRIVPCIQDKVRALSLVDEEIENARNPLTLYQSMQKKWFAVPGFELRKLWIHMRQKCKNKGKMGTESDPVYKDYSR